MQLSKRSTTLGHCYHKEERFSEAVNTFMEVLAVRPELTDLYPYIQKASQQNEIKNNNKDNNNNAKEAQKEDECKSYQQAI